MSPLLSGFTVLLDSVLNRGVATLDLEAIRRSREAVYPTVPPFTWVTGPLARDVRIDTASVTTRDGASIPVRIYGPTASQPLGTLVFFHGGGWVQGNTRRYDPLCSHLASRTPVTVVNVDYRLAPEHRAPTAAYDCMDATRALLADPGRLGLAMGRVGVAGDSAGGNLAAVVAQTLPEQIHAQVLIYPGVDMRMLAPSIAQNAEGPVLTRADMDVFKALYLGPDPVVAETDPLVSPLFGVVPGLPPALIQAAELDPLRDDAAMYAAALQEAAVPTRLTTYVGVPHGFASFPGVTGIGRQHRAEIVSWLQRHLSPASSAR